MLTALGNSTTVTETANNFTLTYTALNSAEPSDCSFLLDSEEGIVLRLFDFEGKLIVEVEDGEPVTVKCALLP